MFISATATRRDFAETLLLSPPEPALPLPYDGSQSGLDPIEQMALAERADRSLLILVASAAAATLLLALAAGLA